MKQTRTVSLSALFAGALLLLGGLGGFASLHVASRGYESTTGVIEEFQQEVVYRHRKRHYKNHLRIRFTTPRYGDQRVTYDSHWPFRSKGDEITLWYRPDNLQEIRLPYEEAALWTLLTAAGAICIYGGLSVRRRSRPEKNGENDTNH